MYNYVKGLKTIKRRKNVNIRHYRPKILIIIFSVSETVLLAWICGDEAKYMEGLKMNHVADTCTMILKKFLADPMIPKPKSCLL